MKTIMKLALASMIIAVVFSACSRTRDAVGLDTMYNAISVGRWVKYTESVGPTGGTAVTTEHLTDGQYMTFSKTNGNAFIYNSDGSQVAGSEHSYSFTDTKTMVFDGNTYKIMENFAGSFNTITLTREAAGITTKIVFNR